MSFFKKHYEKVILSIVLLGLTAALGFIPVRLSSVEATLESGEKEITNSPPKKLAALELSHESQLVARLTAPKPISLSEPHHLVNPVRWQKRTNGPGDPYIKDEKGNNIGAGAVKILKIDPLYFRVSFEKNQSSAGNYNFTIIRQDGPPRIIAPGYNPKTTKTVNAEGNTIETPSWNVSNWERCVKISLTLTKIEGPADSPTAFVFSRSDKPNETITVGPDKPFAEVRGYEADLVYPPENRNFNNYRRGMAMVFAGETNNIVDIKSDLVVVSSATSNKQTDIKK